MDPLVKGGVTMEVASLLEFILNFRRWGFDDSQWKSFLLCYF